MRRDIATGVFIGGMFVLLLALAIFMPGNGVTGRVVDPPCARGECLALCDANDQCLEGQVCCATAWESGVCGAPADCAMVREYSLYQSIEVYSDTVREGPSPVRADWSRFFLPLLLTIAVVAYLARHSSR